MRSMICCLALVFGCSAWLNAEPTWLAGPENEQERISGIEVTDWNESWPESGTAPDQAAAAAFEAAVARARHQRGGASEMSFEPVIYGPGFTREVMVATVWDDGSGPALYAGGQLLTAGRHQALGIARWDGQEWSPLGLGVNGTVRALIDYDGDLIVAGDFTQAANAHGDVVEVNNIARWDGTSWSALGAGFKGPTADQARVLALAVHDGQLVAGGSWLPEANQPTSWIARWDGQAWSEIGGGFNQSVWDLAVLDGDLFASGTFTRAGDQPALRVARWDGDQWSAVGSGMDGAVIRIAAYDGDLYAGGVFSNAGGNFASRIARWDGSAWSPVGNGVVGTLEPNVRSFHVFNGELVVAGTFTHAGGQPANHVARWNGTTWARLIGPSGSGVGGMVGDLSGAVSALSDFEGKLFAGGMFHRAGGVRANYVAQWSDGDGWSAQSESGNGLINYSHINNAPARALVQYGDDLIAGGGFDDVSGLPSTGRIARWDGSQWHAMGGGIDVVHAAYGQNVTALGVANGQLYVGGNFNSVSGVPGTQLIARWDGSQWHAVGQGISGAPPGASATVNALIEFEGDLYAGGTFLQASGTPASGIARWDGTQWSPLGTGTNGTVSAMAVYQDSLIVAGSFTQAGGVVVNRVARWDGTEWSALGSGTNAGIQALVVHGNELIAAGDFTQAGGTPASRVARWDGSEWSSLAGGIFGNWGTWPPRVSALGSFNGDLYATGLFSSADGGGQGGIIVNSIARWDGTRWWPLDGPAGNGLTGGPNNPWAFSMGVYEPASGPPRLMVGGFHLLTAGVPSWGLGSYGLSSLEIAPGNLDFGAVSVGQVSAEQTLTLTSNASSTLTIHQIDGLGSDFQMTASGSCPEAPIILQPGQQCTVAVRFEPIGPGVVSSQVHFYSDQPASPKVVELTGVAGDGALALLPAELNFGHVAVGAQAGPQVATLINATPTPLNLTALDVESGPFLRIGGSCSDTPFVLQPQAGCTVHVQYQPQDPGSDAYALNITHDQGNQAVELVGAAHSPHLLVVPPLFDFGDLPLGDDAGTAVITIANPTGIAAEVTTIDWPGEPFKLVAGTCPLAPFVLAGGDHCLLEFAYEPQSVGQSTGVLMVSSDALAVPAEVVLTGLASGATLRVEPGQVERNVVAGSNAAASLSLSNDGDAALSWSVAGSADAGAVLRPAGRSGATGPAVHVDLDSVLRSGMPAHTANHPLGSSSSGQTITHSHSMDVLGGNSVACSLFGTTSENRFLRVFDLDDFGFTEGFEVERVTFGIERLQAMMPLTVNLYTLEGAFEYGNLTPLASKTQLLGAQELSLVEYELNAWVPPRGVLVVELLAPDVTGLTAFWPGSNTMGQSAPSYWAAPGCDVTEPTALESLGFSSIHLAMSVTGQAVANCALPPWVTSSTGQGEIAPAETTTLGLQFDASGLPINTYRANLCLQSNDGLSPITVVPLLMNVVAESLFHDRFE